MCELRPDTSSIPRGQRIYTAAEERVRAAQCDANEVQPNIVLKELRRTRERLERQQSETEHKLFTVRQLISLFE
jgi:hypothetical protein